MYELLYLVVDNVISPRQLVARFCGILSMETVYARTHEAVLIIQSSAELVPMAITLEATYQIHQQNAAYRYNKDLNCFLHTLNVNRPVSLVFGHFSMIEYIWYLSSSVPRVRLTRSVISKIAISINF